LIRKGWTLLQRTHKGDYWPKPQAFVEAIIEARQDRLDGRPVMALPKPPEGDRHDEEVEKIMQSIVIGSSMVRQIVKEGVVSFLMEYVKKRKINGPQDIDQSWLAKCKSDYRNFLKGVEKANDTGVLSKTLVKWAESAEQKQKAMTDKYKSMIAKQKEVS
jgi:hypothetical protein